jgi:uncharacterized protein
MPHRARPTATVLRTLAVFLLGLLLLGFLLVQPAHAKGQCLPPPETDKLPWAQLKAQAKDTGFLWRISKDGRASYLHGTVHVARQAWVMPGPRTLDALKDSDALALELDVLNPHIQKEMQAAFKRTFDTTPVNAAQRSRIKALADQLCVPTQQLQGTSVLMQLVQLMLQDVRSKGLEAAYGRDVVLSGIAHNEAKPVYSLETVATQVKAIDQPMTAKEVSEFLDGLEQGTFREVLSKLAELWAGNQLEQLAKVDAWCPSCKDDPLQAQMMTQVNDERNPAMAQTIDKLHRKGHSLFVAVGALHMTGPQALPKLLQGMGYRVERLF